MSTRQDQPQQHRLSNYKVKYERRLWHWDKRSTSKRSSSGNVLISQSQSWSEAPLHNV